MGFLAPAIPWIIKGGAALGGALLGKKAQSSAMQRSPEEQMALGGAQTAAGALGEQGKTLTNLGLPAVSQSTDYYQTLLRGSRPAMAMATAGPRAAITDVYRGAERNLDRSGIRGAQRDVAEAELGRQRASQISGLTTGVQPYAADALNRTGMGLLGQGTSALQGVGSIWSNLLGQGAENRQYGRQEGEKFGGSMGSLIFDILNGTIGKFGKGGGSGLLGGGVDLTNPKNIPGYTPGMIG